MKMAKVFANGGSQAVRLPKEFRFDESEVVVRRFGDGVLLLPSRVSWDDWFKRLDDFPDDYMADRDQPAEPERREGF